MLVEDKDVSVVYSKRDKLPPLHRHPPDLPPTPFPSRPQQQNQPPHPLHRIQEEIQGRRQKEVWLWLRERNRVTVIIGVEGVL